MSIIVDRLWAYCLASNKATKECEQLKEEIVLPSKVAFGALQAEAEARLKTKEEIIRERKNGTFKGEWDAALAFAGVALDSPQQHRYTPSLMVVEVEESLETPPALPQVNIPHPKVPLIPSAPSALAAPLAPTIDSLLIDMDALLEDDS
ncbi:unnamed protein product, partial [Ilex paraguariensis]